VHEKVKPFVCEFEGCGLAFGFKKVLQRHYLTHTHPAPPRVRKVVKDVGLINELAGTGYEDTGRDIDCIVEGCEWRFTREYDLKRHLASFHQGKVEDTIDMAGVSDLN
jgi:general transcription factor IIIA